jgi:hypothetical protein
MLSGVAQVSRQRTEDRRQKMGKFSDDDMVDIENGQFLVAIYVAGV